MCNTCYGLGGDCPDCDWIDPEEELDQELNDADDYNQTLQDDDDIHRD